MSIAIGSCEEIFSNRVPREPPRPTFLARPPPNASPFLCRHCIPRHSCFIHFQKRFRNVFKILKLSNLSLSLFLYIYVIFGIEERRKKENQFSSVRMEAVREEKIGGGRGGDLHRHLILHGSSRTSRKTRGERRREVENTL